MVGGEGDDRRWDDRMASLTRWTWVWVSSRNWWWAGNPIMLLLMGSQRVGQDWGTELNWTERLSTAHNSTNEVTLCLWLQHLNCPLGDTLASSFPRYAVVGGKGIPQIPWASIQSLCFQRSVSDFFFRSTPLSSGLDVDSWEWTEGDSESRIKGSVDTSCWPWFQCDKDA